MIVWWHGQAGRIRQTTYRMWRITARSRATDSDQRQLAEGRRELDRLKAQLLAVVSHEFRTPLAGIIGLSETLQRSAGRLDEATTAEVTGHISANARKLARLVDNVLAAAGPVLAEPAAATPLRTVVDEVVAEVRRDHVEAIPDLVVTGAEDTAAAVKDEHLRLLLWNLVDNAVKFANPCEPVVIAIASAGPDVEVTASNVGATIPDGLEEQLFEPFTQVDSSDTRPHDGLGLGLYVVRRILAAYDGTIALQHDEGRTTVSVRLPAAAVRTLTLPEPAART